jgi:hypothetical protein
MRGAGIGAAIVKHADARFRSAGIRIKSSARTLRPATTGRMRNGGGRETILARVCIRERMFVTVSKTDRTAKSKGGIAFAIIMATEVEMHRSG